MMKLELKTPWAPCGDQPQAINLLSAALKKGLRHTILLGVTGSGKTFTVANIIARLQEPTLIIAHNKTLAAQLYQEYREFFPNNAVHFFVSYYDYYQPESYLPASDTYIAKEATINKYIDQMRLATTNALLSRQDVIVIASVSCIYNLGSPQEYSQRRLILKKGMPCSRQELLKKLTANFYQRQDQGWQQGQFRVQGETIDLWSADGDKAWRIELLEEKISQLWHLDPFNNQLLEPCSEIIIFPAKHFLSSAERFSRAIEEIKTDLQKRLAELRQQGKELEAHRLEQRTNYDLELMHELGYCPGIENYARYFDQRAPGEPPTTLLDFFAYSFGKNFLIVIDESHMTLPQIRGMYRGDQARKEKLIDYGFRLPSALDNRPLRFAEFLERAPKLLYTSATPGEWEIEAATQERRRKNLSPQQYPALVEQLIRPTLILDPEVEVRGTRGQLQNLINEIIIRQQKGERVLVTTLTKKLAEELSHYLQKEGIKACYLHSDIETLERSDILADLRRGVYDVLIGINLLREGLDLPEVSLVAILDADKEGFLRSRTALIQVMGRAARHREGKVIMYAQKITPAMQSALDEVKRRRKIQAQYNRRHSLKPRSIKKPIREKLIERPPAKAEKKEKRGGKKKFFLFLNAEKTIDNRSIAALKKEMWQAAQNLDFEKAAFLRDLIAEKEGKF